MPPTAINADECARASVCRIGFVQVGIPIVLESSLPVHQPQTVAVEEHIVRLEQVVMTRRQIRIETRVRRGHLLVTSEKFLGLVFRQNARRPELLQESVQGGSFVQQERACGIEG